MPKILQDDKTRTFVPPDEMENIPKLSKDRLRIFDDKTDTSSADKIIAKMKMSQDLERDKSLKNINKYKSINLNDVDNLINEINSNITERDNIVELGNGKSVYFRGITEFIYDIKDGKITNFNKKEEYEKRFWNTNVKLVDKTKNSKNIRLYEKYLNNLRKMLFDDKKLSGKGLNISSLPILLSKIYTNNSSKKLIHNIEQLINNSYDNKQITKQVYNNLNKAITYKNDSQRSN